MSKPQFESNPTDRRYELFPGQRRRVKIEHVTPQANLKADDRKIVFHVRMVLTGQPLIGFPGFLQPAWEAAEKESSLVTQSRMNGFTLDGIRVEYFSQETSKRHLVSTDNKTLYDFTIEREKDGESYVTVLRFKYRAKETKGAYAFWVDHGLRELWLEFTPSANSTLESDDRQMSLVQNSGGESDERGENDDLPDQDYERADAVSEAND